MRVTIATEPAPGHVNEDFAAATAQTAVLLDGVGLSGVDDGGCLHGVAWYVRRLGGELLARLTDRPDADLRLALGDAIGDVSQSHRSTCDIDHPGTPSSTVVVATVKCGVLRYLVLADSTLVICGPERHQRVVTDSREADVGRRFRTGMDSVTGGTPDHDEARRSYVEALRGYRNRVGGFWVAAASPDAAAHALTGEVEVATAASALLLSDGASRLVDRFRLCDWDHVAQVSSTEGPEALLAAVREAESADPHGRRWPRGKIFDDATVVYCDRLAG